MALPNKPTIKNVWATSGVKVEPSDTKVNAGWIVERPPHQFQNFLQNRSDQFLKHINEAGIPVWDAATVYTANRSYVQGSDGKLYKALTNGANQNPVGNPTNWMLTLGDADFQEIVDQAQDSATQANAAAADAIDAKDTAESAATAASSDAATAIAAKDQSVSSAAEALISENNAAASAAAALVSKNAAAVSEANAAATLDGAAKKVDLASTASGKGGEMVAVSLPVATPYLQTISAIANGDAVSTFRFINPTQFSAIRGFTSTYDAAPAIQLAFDSGAKRLVCDYGLFNMSSTANISGSLSLEGAGEGTVFKQIGITNKSSFYLKSSSSSTFIDGVRFKNFTLQCLDGTFFEQQHLIELNGAENVLFEGLRLYGFRGDGIYLGSGVGAEERHNRNVKILNCVFDGVNRENRNAISIIDCDGITIQGNTFLRSSKSTMPGPIDFEPNANTWHIIRGVRVLNNRFIANGGNLGEIGFAVPSNVTEAPNDIEISGNHSRGYLGTGAFITNSINRLPTATSEESVFKIARNRVTTGYRPYNFVNGKNILLDGNSWADFAQAAILGSNVATGEVRDVSLRNENYTRVGSIGGNGLIVFTATGLKIEDSLFSDCGTGVAALGNAIDFNVGTSSGVRLRNVSFTSPTGKTLVAIAKEAGHTFSPLTNSYTDCRHGSLNNVFAAEESNVILSDYPTANPAIIEGGTNVGTTVTYTERYTRYRCEGDWVTAYARMNVLSHDGAGPIELSLPRAAAALAGSNNLRSVGSFMISGISGITGPVLGRLNIAASAGGLQGAIRFYTVTSGVEALVNIPGAGIPFVVEGAFEYMAQPRAN